MGKKEKKKLFSSKSSCHHSAPVSSILTIFDVWCMLSQSPGTHGYKKWTKKPNVAKRKKRKKKNLIKKEGGVFQVGALRGQEV